MTHAARALDALLRRLTPVSPARRAMLLLIAYAVAPALTALAPRIHSHR